MQIYNEAHGKVEMEAQWVTAAERLERYDS